MAGEAPIEHDIRWPVVSLAEIATKIGSGATPKGGADTYLPIRERFALVRSQNVFDRRFDHAGLAFITGKQAEGLRGVALQPADILLNITGDGITFGRACMVPEDVLPACVNQHVSIVRVDTRRADAGYVLAFLTHSDVKSYIESFNAGGSRRAITKGHIESFRLPLPPLSEQRAIAHILGALDDKIELNRRTSETLEAMARVLFKLWFVDFDPVRAKLDGRWRRGQSLPGMPAHLYDLFPDRMVESELGVIPEGWEGGAIENLCESITSGGTPTRMNAAFWNDGTIPWFKTGELLDGPLLDSEEHITEMALANSSCKLWPEGTILFALYASPTVGRLGVLTSPGTSNQAAAGLMAKASYGIPFLRRVLLDARQKLQSIAVGAAQQNINQAVLKSHQIVIPSMALAMEYSRRISASDAKQVALAREMRNLADLRDTLLPKLISGELRVPEVMRMAEAVS